MERYRAEFYFFEENKPQRNEGNYIPLETGPRVTPAAHKTTLDNLERLSRIRPDTQDDLPLLTED